MSSLREIISGFFRPYRNKKRQKYFLKKYGPVKEDYIILSNNCLGGMCYKDANKQFLSPTINLTIDNYLSFLKHYKTYISSEIVEVKEKEESYPVGEIRAENLPVIRIGFVHYSSFSEAVEKWKERAMRTLNSDAKICILYCIPSTEILDQKTVDELMSFKPNKLLCLYRETNTKLPENTDSIAFVHIPEKYHDMDYLKFVSLFSRVRFIDKFCDVFKFLYTY